jgi:hypothetical protein
MQRSCSVNEIHGAGIAVSDQTESQLPQEPTECKFLVTPNGLVALPDQVLDLLDPCVMQSPGLQLCARFSAGD